MIILHNTQILGKVSTHCTVNFPVFKVKHKVFIKAFIHGKFCLLSFLKQSMFIFKIDYNPSIILLYKVVRVLSEAWDLNNYSID